MVHSSRGLTGNPIRHASMLAKEASTLTTMDYIDVSLCWPARSDAVGIRVVAHRTGEAVARFGITGHMNLTPESVPLIRKAITDVLAPYAGEEMTGVSCIARGADSIFAQTVLDLGGKLEVVLPATSYRETKVKPDDAPVFDALLCQATTVRVMPFAEANRD